MRRRSYDDGRLTLASVEYRTAKMLHESMSRSPLEPARQHEILKDIIEKLAVDAGEVAEEIEKGMTHEGR